MDSDDAEDGGCDYLTRQQYHERDDAWQKIGAMFNRMIERTDDFCRSATRH